LDDEESLKNLLKNVRTSDLTVEYLFIENAEKQIKPINDDQGYVMGFINFFFDEGPSRDLLTYFQTTLLDELTYTAKYEEYFKKKSVNLDEYKFGIVDEMMNVKEYPILNSSCFAELLTSSKNLLIAGKNFSFDEFKAHEIFKVWFEKYCNK